MKWVHEDSMTMTHRSSSLQTPDSDESIDAASCQQGVLHVDGDVRDLWWCSSQCGQQAAVDRTPHLHQQVIRTLQPNHTSNYFTTYKYNNFFYKLRLLILNCEDTIFIEEKELSMWRNSDT